VGAMDRSQPFTEMQTVVRVQEDNRGPEIRIGNLLEVVIAPFIPELALRQRIEVGPAPINGRHSGKIPGAPDAHFSSCYWRPG
jgi:hypothetical protein